VDVVHDLEVDNRYLVDGDLGRLNHCDGGNGEAGPGLADEVHLVASWGHGHLDWVSAGALHYRSPALVNEDGGAGL
jgi:hypothetical protein